MAFLCVALLLLPYFLALPLVGGSLNFDISEFTWALKNTLLQAFGSGILATFFGFLGAICLTSDGHLLRLLFLIPGILPTLFLIISFFSLTSHFPMGLPGIVIAHTFIFFGVIAVGLSEAMKERLGSYAEIGLILGIKKITFLSRIALPLLKKDLLHNFLFVFASSFSSFTIPLFFGGTTSSTLEILIYEKMRESSNWSYPLLLSLIQSFLLYFFLIWKKSSKQEEAQARKTHLPRLDLFRVPFLRFLFMTILGAFFFAYLRSIVLGFSDYSHFFSLLSELSSAIFSTLFIAIATGILCATFFLFLLYLLPHRRLENLLRGFIAPSSAVACFGFLIWGNNEGLALNLKIVTLLTLLFFPALYRMGFQSKFESLLRQTDVALILGASRPLIFRGVLLPQMASRIFLLSGIGATWAAGEFAITKVLAGNDFTLALQIRSLMTSYRIELAGALSFILILLCLFIFSIFYGASRVLYSKS